VRAVQRLGGRRMITEIEIEGYASYQGEPVAVSGLARLNYFFGPPLQTEKVTRPRHARGSSIGSPCSPTWVR
jgi:hypothetical protein